MGRRSKKKGKDKDPKKSKYASKLERRANEDSETQHIPIEKLTPKLTMEQKQLLMTEMRYGLDGSTIREYTDLELKFIVGYCLYEKLISNFSFLPIEAAKYIAPALRDESKREAAIEALQGMDYEAARYIAPALGDEKQREAAIEALQGMDYKAAKYIAPALGDEKQREAAIEALQGMDYKAAKYIAPALGDESKREAAIEALQGMDYKAARYIAPALGDESKREAAIEAFSKMNPKAARYIAPALGDEKQREAAIEAIYKIELTHKGKAVGAIIRKGSELEKGRYDLLNGSIYSAIKKIYQMKNSPIKRYMDLAMKLVREENKPKFFSGLEKVLTT